MTPLCAVAGLGIAAETRLGTASLRGKPGAVTASSAEPVHGPAA